MPAMLQDALVNPAPTSFYRVKALQERLCRRILQDDTIYAKLHRLVVLRAWLTDIAPQRPIINELRLAAVFIDSSKKPSRKPHTGSISLERMFFDVVTNLLE